MKPLRATHDYVGFWKDCDCIVAVCVDLIDHPRETAKDVADFIRRGYRVQRYSHADFRELDWHCPKHPKGTTPPWEGS